MKSILKYLFKVFCWRILKVEEAEFKLWQTDCLIPRVWLLVGLRQAFFFFLWGSGRGTERGLLIFLTKYQNYRPLKNFRSSLEIQFFTDHQHWTCSTVSLGHGIVAHTTSIGREKSGAWLISWGELQLLTQQPSTYSGKDATKSMTLSSNHAFPRETHKI